MNNSRAIAAKIVFAVIEQKQSLTQVLATHLNDVSAQDRAFIQQMCYGTLRWLPRLEQDLTPLLKQNPKGKDKVAYALLLVGLYQINYLSVPHHAAIHATVDAAAKLTPRLKNLVNAVLRNYLRGLKPDAKPVWKTPEATHVHPRWLIDSLKADYPEHYAQIMAANNAHPPMWIRVNTQKTTRDAYQARLQEQGIDAVPSAEFQMLCAWIGHVQSLSFLDSIKVSAQCKMPALKQQRIICSHKPVKKYWMCAQRQVEKVYTYYNNAQKLSLQLLILTQNALNVCKKISIEPALKHNSFAVMQPNQMHGVKNSLIRFYWTRRVRDRGYSSPS